MLKYVSRVYCDIWLWYINRDFYSDVYTILKLVNTNLSYRLVGTSTAIIFLSNDNSLYATVSSDERHAWFHM